MDAKIVWIISQSYESYGPLDEHGRKPLSSSERSTFGKASSTKEGARKLALDHLKRSSENIGSVIGRKPDIEKEEVTDAFFGGDGIWEAYVAWNLSDEDAKKAKEIFEDAVPGGAIELCVTYGGIELID